MTSFPSLSQKLTFFSDQTPLAQTYLDFFSSHYEIFPLEEADTIVVLGGDGYMLRVLHQLLAQKKSIPVYGINCGTVGFLMNTFSPHLNDLALKLDKALPIHLHPLFMSATTQEEALKTAYAINEVSLLRQTSQSAKLSIFVDDILRLETLIGDGILLSTPAGSTAYNFSAGGPILPLQANLLALTPINIFRPRRWHGALLPKSVRCRFDILDSDKRPLKCTADFYEIPSCTSVTVHEDVTQSLTLLFDPDHNLEGRILEEQFRS